MALEFTSLTAFKSHYTTTYSEIIGDKKNDWILRDNEEADGSILETERFWAFLAENADGDIVTVRVAVHYRKSDGYIRVTNDPFVLKTQRWLNSSLKPFTRRLYESMDISKDGAVIGEPTGVNWDLVGMFIDNVDNISETAHVRCSWKKQGVTEVKEKKHLVFTASGGGLRLYTDGVDSTLIYETI